jgi:predicted Zn-dependent protease
MLIGGAGVALSVALARTGANPPLPASLATAFQVIGTPVKIADRLVTRIIPVSAIDERDFGEVLRARYDAQADTTSQDFLYLNDIVTNLARRSQKPFTYRVYVVDGGAPNAMALPGGVILVTRGLLQVLQSEAELASVLAHELGHIELGHCLDAVRFSLLAEKVDMRPIGELVDMSLRALASHSFSKTVEDAADQYSFTMMDLSPYDPRGVGNAFASLIRFRGEQRADRATPRTDVLRDYYSSHPPLEIREAAFRERAEAWWRTRGNERRHLGADNLRERVSVFRAPPR